MDERLKKKLKLSRKLQEFTIYLGFLGTASSPHDVSYCHMPLLDFKGFPIHKSTKILPYKSIENVEAIAMACWMACIFAVYGNAIVIGE